MAAISLKPDNLGTDQICAGVLTPGFPDIFTGGEMTIDDLVHLAAHLTASGLRSVALSTHAIRPELQLDLKEDVLALVIRRLDGDLTVLLWRPDGTYVREALRLPGNHRLADLLPR